MLSLTSVVVSVSILVALVSLFSIILIMYYLHHGFSSGSWFNENGDTLLIRNRGILGKSEMLIAEQDGDKYNVLKYKCRMLINPLSLPHQFTMYVLDEVPLTAKIDMLTGKLELFAKGKHYGTFCKSNIRDDKKTN